MSSPGFRVREIRRLYIEVNDKLEWRLTFTEINHRHMDRVCAKPSWEHVLR